MSQPEPPPGDAQAVVGAFLMRYVEDRENEDVQPLHVYQAAFKGYEELIARELAKLERSESVTEGGFKATRPATLGKPLGPGLGETGASTGLDAADEVEGYRLVRVLGEGGMGTVYLARQDRPIERDVALKVIKLGMDTREVVARFDTERQALALMDHPNIAKVYDAGQTRSGRPYFAMEHFPGTPITDFCDASRLDVTARVQLVIDACDAVQHAHQKGVIHRDLKPTNVLVALREGRPTPKIIDFGIAKSMRQPLTERTLETQLGQLIGTPAYMSPEQAQFGGLDIDTRADLYALGMILYEVLVGALPFEQRSARDLAAFIQQIVETEPARPSTRLTRLGEKLDTVTSARRTDRRTLASRLRGDLDWIAMKSIEKDRDRRYGSASELADDLRRHLAHEPVLAGPPTFTYRARKFVRRRRRSLAVGATVIVLLLGSAYAANFVSEARARKERIDTSRVALGEAESALGHHRRLKDSLGGLKSSWRASMADHETWEPVWRREDEIKAWRKWRQARRDADVFLGEAITKFEQTLELAVPESPEMVRTRHLLTDVLLVQYETSVMGQASPLDATYWERRILALDEDAYREHLQKRGRLELSSDPPGAEVYCFRYQFREGRLLPLPYRLGASTGQEDIGSGFVGSPFLEVESVTRPGVPLKSGDRLVAIDDTPIGDRGEFVARFQDVQPGEEVRVRIRRDGQRLDVTWTPFTDDSEKTRPDIAGRFGVRFSGYPLDHVDACRLGTTHPDAPLPVQFPQGSYLLIFRQAGFEDARLPVAVPLPRPEQGASSRVRLVRKSEMPEGFIYIPEGPVAFGGDAYEADQSLEAGYESVAGFFMQRLEVTVGEYLEFLNTPEMLARVGPDGNANARVDWDQVFIDGKRLSEFVLEEIVKTGRIQLIPREQKKLLFTKGKPDDVKTWNEDRWMSTEWRAPTLTARWPVLGLSRLAALEYAQWQSEKNGGRWKFRLPTDLEWEKAARGVDRRTYVWGDYLVYSFCKSNQGTPKPNVPALVGSYPTDESVFGVRDLAGSAGEPTLGQITGKRFLAYRGGDWYHVEESWMMIANRNGWPAETSWISNGIRLVAEMEE